jgi:hypothetical protein
MKKYSFIILMILLQFALFPQQIKLDDEIPLDKNILIGKLDNGLKYYIRVNKKLTDRTFLLLIYVGNYFR